MASKTTGIKVIGTTDLNTWLNFRRIKNAQVIRKVIARDRMTIDDVARTIDRYMGRLIAAGRVRKTDKNYPPNKVSAAYINGIFIANVTFTAEIAQVFNDALKTDHATGRFEQDDNLNTEVDQKVVELLGILQGGDEKAVRALWKHIYGVLTSWTEKESLKKAVEVAK